MCSNNLVTLPIVFSFGRIDLEITTLHRGLTLCILFKKFNKAPGFSGNSNLNNFSLIKELGFPPTIYLK